MSSIFSTIEVNNMSLLTYGAIGITSIVLAVVTIFDKEGGPEMASVVEPEVSPDETSVAGLFSNNETPDEDKKESSLLPEIFSNNETPQESQEESVSGENISNENAVIPETQVTENQETQSENEEREQEEPEKLMGGKKRKHKSNTKKYGKSQGKKQRKRMTKTRTK